jgi:hypothetical protein
VRPIGAAHRDRAIGAEERAMAGKKWSDLSMRSRKLIIGASVAEGVLKTAALIDIKRRPASEIRGPKWVWVPVVVILNSCGAVPLAYFLFGRRPAPAAESD